jgi:hypothetical protein
MSLTLNILDVEDLELIPAENEVWVRLERRVRQNQEVQISQ